LRTFLGFLPGIQRLIWPYFSSLTGRGTPYLNCWSRTCRLKSGILRKPATPTKVSTPRVFVIYYNNFLFYYQHLVFLSIPISKSCLVSFLFLVSVVFLIEYKYFCLVINFFNLFLAKILFILVLSSSLI
jgi:hypothetical protein